jgi:CopG family transcriptional regulator / antitoxin EndoAI
MPQRDRSVGHHYVSPRRRAELKKRLQEGATRRAERDRALAAEWFDVEEEAWSRERK